MAKNEIAAMLDELMGRNRNAHPNEKVADITWEDSSVCKYFLVDFCPHDLFTNTKVDLGVCPRIHDEELKKKYEAAKEGSKKMAVLDEFISYCQKMMNDLSLKIKRSKERLLLTQMEQAAAAGMSKQQQEEVEMKIQILTDKINHLVDQAEKAGCQ
ncbi:luc7-like protein 3, partial [Eurytemora carolleeae]|uniref:luc7-like protein 3 n=1 Tax=Eurytemora carolleeae TaxID=1294199 RepID=UPI000C776041